MIKLYLFCVIFLSACAHGEENLPTATAQPTRTPALSPSPHLTSSPTVSPSPTQLPSTTPKPDATATFAPVSQERIEAPILLYHHVSLFSGGDRTYTTTPRQFKEQMELLNAAGYHAVTTTQLAAALRGEGGLPSRPVLIVFDDGYQDVYENAYPILRDLGFTATMNVIVKMIDGPSYLSAEQVRELADAGWEIGSHSQTHANLVKTGDPIAEICGSKRDLEKMLGQDVRTFAFPYGAANPYVMQIAKDCGYTSGGGVGPLTSHSLKSIFFLSRVTIDGKWTLEQFRQAFQGQNIDQ